MTFALSALLHIREFKTITYFLHQNLKIDLDQRVTIIDFEGSVLYDSKKDNKKMDNHINRPEIIQSNLEKFGLSVRYSETLKQDFIYLIKRSILMLSTHI